MELISVDLGPIIKTIIAIALVATIGIIVYRRRKQNRWPF